MKLINLNPMDLSRCVHILFLFSLFLIFGCENKTTTIEVPVKEITINKSKEIEEEAKVSAKAAETAKEPAKSAETPEEPIQGRWYTLTQVDEGKKIYNRNCISCHLNEGQGSPNWKTPLANGKFPPPPLNGTAHAWHHPRSALFKQIKEGSLNMGGSMPPQGSILSDDQIYSVIAYINSLWPEETYQTWFNKVGLD